ncbi:MULTISPECIES: hypothetical protein [Vibrio]|uniref:hypothetical protein n=1 Tax=Vibrio TaxID=662 RepID=UPI0026580C00|nr:MULTISPECIES: hypothetical protein [Vibrio]MCE9842942.1 hypothetical protein [Vibrio antiquarius]MDW2012338.1 hypothetical protein [Vibrio sp. Vb0301]
MAFDAPIEPLTAHSTRECNFYINYLSNAIRGSNFKTVESFETVQECLKSLNQEISYQKKKGSISYSQIKQMQAEFLKDQLNSEGFSWLDKSDERLCNWVWCYLKSESGKRKRRNRAKADSHTNVGFDLNQDVIALDPKVIESKKETKPRYRQLCAQSFRNTSNNLHDRRKDIVESFRHSELSLPEQKRVIEALLTEWKIILDDRRIVNWFSKNNTEQFVWAWSYIEKFDHQLVQEVWISTNDHDLKNTAIALFDMLHDRPDRKALIIGGMKRAWSQKKFRDKDKKDGKKAYSISMTEKTKQKLDSLAEHKGLKINETIEMLIRNEFEKL